MGRLEGAGHLCKQKRPTGKGTHGALHRLRQKRLSAVRQKILSQNLQPAQSDQHVRPVDVVPDGAYQYAAS